MPRAVLIGLAVLLLAVVLMTTDALPALRDVVDRGDRLSRCTLTDDGIVVESAAELVAQAVAVVGHDVNVDAYSLARMVRSEESSAGQIAKNYLCHVMMNQADALGWGITQVIQFHTTSTRANRYGKQISGRVASASDPYEADLAVAEHSLAERAQGLDPTGGATNFVDKRAFGVQAGTGSFEDLVSRWAVEGKTPGTLPDTHPALVFFWRNELPSQAEGFA